MPLEFILLKSIPSAIKHIEIEDNSIVLSVDQSKLKFVTTFLKLSSLTNFKLLLDIWASDLLKANNKRYTLYYMLASIQKNQRLFIKSNPIINRGIVKAESLTSIFASSGFLEREVWDLMGIFFISHPDLRRLLTDYGFNGFPLRKDFPVTGFREIRYDDESAKLIYEPVRFAQAYRIYLYENPWIKQGKEE
jgi:NADH:ubiquinone oxidoreductase subunit C